MNKISMSARVKILFVVFSLLTLALFIADLMFGSVKVSPAEIAAVLTGGGDGSVNERIIIDIRLVKAIVAVIAGAALSVSGLQMQTLFQNPLAGPSVLGVTSGASLGAALLIIGLPVAGGMSPVLSSFGVAGAAWLGAAAVMAVIVAVSRRIKDIMVILILGMMFSSGVSAVVQVLQYVSNESALKSFVIWTMGALGDVTYTQLALLAPVFLAGMVLAVAAVKPLNLLFLPLDVRVYRELLQAKKKDHRPDGKPKMRVAEGKEDGGEAKLEKRGEQSWQTGEGRPFIALVMGEFLLSPLRVGAGGVVDVGIIEPP